MAQRKLHRDDLVERNKKSDRLCLKVVLLSKKVDASLILFLKINHENFFKVYDVASSLRKLLTTRKTRFGVNLERQKHSVIVVNLLKYCLHFVRHQAITLGDAVEFLLVVSTRTNIDGEHIKSLSH